MAAAHCGPSIITAGGAVCRASRTGLAMRTCAPPAWGSPRTVVSEVVAAMMFQRRWQSLFGENRATARRSTQAYSHPLAPQDPAARNIVLPDSVHATRGAKETLSAEILQKRAQRALALQLRQEVLWEGTVVDDVHHTVMQHFAKLRQNPKYRSARQMMIVGGREMLRELFEGGFTPRHLLIGADKKEEQIPPWVKESGSQIVRVERRILDECVPGTDGYVGDFDVPTPPPKEHLIANKQRFERVLVLDNVDDSGVLGTVLRTAAGFHYDAVITINHCADLYDHRVMRAARAAHFQRAVPFYSLREEDGDDAMAMLNHVIERNNLTPLCFSPIDDAEAPVGRPYARQSLGDYCLQRFAGLASPSSALGAGKDPANCTLGQRDRAEGGYILFAGPNHKRNLMKRISQRVIRPATQVLLEDMPTTDLAIALPIVLFALRPTGDWDYLPVSQQSEPSTAALQTKHASVDLGTDRLDLNWRSISLDEEEQRELAHRHNTEMKERRLAKKQLSDYDMWMKSEEARIREMAKNERQRLVSPWKIPKPVKEKGARGMPDYVPNIIDEYRLPIDRDRLREELSDSETHIRPQNYDLKGGVAKRKG